MRKLYLFMMISLDGYFEGENHDISWHNADNQEFNDFAIAQLKTIGTILFGRKTYEGMASWWTGETALKMDPIVAGLMNGAEKYVFSHTLEKADWENTELVKDDGAQYVRKLKTRPGKDIAIFGSNNFCVSMMEAGLVDEFRIMVNPVALGKGNSLFTGLTELRDFKFSDIREFKNGNVLSTYVQA